MRSLLLALLLFGCWHVTVPSSLAGDIPLVLVNEANDSICDLRMTGMNRVDNGNWVHLAMPSGHSVTVKVKPDTYAVTTQGCNNSFVGHMALAISGPLTLRISSTPMPRVEGAATLLVMAPAQPAAPAAEGRVAPAGQCIPDGSTNSNPEQVPCCTHFINDLHQCCSFESEASHCMRSN